MKEIPTIHDACKADNAALVAQMLNDKPALVRATDRYQNNPLHHAASAAVARLLIDYGADVRSLGWMGATPLHDAAQRGQADVVAVLLGAGANVNARRTGQDMPRRDTPLHWAATEATARLLVNAGADICAKDFSARTPLHWAAQFDRPDVIRFLVSCGVPVDDRDSSGETALHLAASGGYVEAVKSLLENGADVNAASKNGRTPLHKVTSERTLLIELLVRSGARLDVRDANGEFPLNAEVQRKLGLAQPRDMALQKQPGFAIKQVRVDMKRRQAIVISHNAILSRWTLDQPPRMIAGIQTTHAWLYDVVILPDADEILVTTSDGMEVRHWGDLRLLRPFAPANGEWESPHALAISPDGLWIAAACRREELYLLERKTGNITGRVEIGERTMAVRFSPDSRLMATACSFQGGAHVRLDEIEPDGSPVARAEFSRSIHSTPAGKFVDTLPHVEFSPDGKYLALFETAAICHDSRPDGWRGNVALYDLETQIEMWSTSIDASITGDPRSLRGAGHGMGYITDIAFSPDGTVIACGATRGTALLLAAADGSLAKRSDLHTDAAVTALAFDHFTGLLFVGLENGEMIALGR